MGMAKDEMMRLEHLGIYPGKGGDVCKDCVCDLALAEFIMANTSSDHCNYCGRKSKTPFACDLGLVVEFMAETIKEEWTDPANELPYESREGGYQGEVLNAYELLEEVGFEPVSSDLFDDVCSWFSGQDWCRDDYFAATPSERHQFGWNSFCREVKHSRRYTFWSSLDDGHPEYHPDHLPPGKMLSEVEEVISDLGLVREFPVGTEFWRAQRHQETQTLPLPPRLTSPPLEKATQPNRMSPAGIPMFYGAEDCDTAILEIAGREADPGYSATAGVFQSLRPLHLLDLIFMGKSVSYFAPHGRTWRHRSKFLRYFSREVSKTIRRDERQHIEYVPTQVFTEYVRHQMRTSEDSPIDGIRYASSISGRPCYVLFFSQKECLMSTSDLPQALSFQEDSVKTISLEHPRT